MSHLSQSVVPIWTNMLIIFPIHQLLVFLTMVMVVSFNKTETARQFWLGSWLAESAGTRDHLSRGIVSQVIATAHFLFVCLYFEN